MEEETRFLVERFEQPTSEENQDLGTFALFKQY